jgi:hypothetical protein
MKKILYAMASTSLLVGVAAVTATIANYLPAWLLVAILVVLLAIMFVGFYNNTPND